MQFISYLALVASLFLVAPACWAQEPAEATMPESSPAIYQPSPLAQRITAADVLGGGHGYVHPFLSVGEFYTDNLFNSPDDKESEWITVISPGISVSVPSTRQPTLDRETVNTAPGGMQLSRLRYEPERRFQGYALYRADLREHAEFPEEETDTHRAEGLLYYRLRGGLAFELMDLFEVDQDPYNTRNEIDGSDVRNLDEFTSNLWRFSVSYPVTPKLALDASYGMFSLNYDAERNEFRERDDQTATVSVYFRILPKTALVLDYQFIDVDYDSAENNRDNREHRYMGGVLWDMTAKSRARLLVGYGNKEFDDGSEGDFVGEARLDYNPTEKTKLYLKAVRRANETDFRNAQDILTYRVQAGYAQRLSARWSGAIDGYYTNDEYRGRDGFTTDREDDRYSAALTFGYAFRRWLSLSFGYSYVKRDSNIEQYEYDTNSVFATVSASL